MEVRYRAAGNKSRAVKYWAAILTGLIVVLISALVLSAIERAKQDAIAQASLKASYLSAGLQEDAEGVLDTLALASEYVKHLIEREEAVPSLAQLRMEIAKYLPGLTAISVIGPDGNLRATSGDVASAPAKYSDFDFFRANKEASSAGFSLGKPITGPFSNRAMIPATQRLQKKNGEFAGVVLFSLDPARATEMYRRVDIGDSGSLLLLGTDGTMLFGYTLPRGLDASLIGTLGAGENALERLKSGSTGTYTATSRLDGVERIFSWRRLSNFPVIALVGLGKAEAVAAAHRQEAHLLALGVLSAGLLIGLTVLLSREIAHRTEQALALAERNAELAAARLDIAERQRYAEQIGRLLGEVNHRSKNMLAVVQAIARQTVKADPADFIERFAARIQALAASQDLLVEREWQGVDLNELAKSQLGHIKDMIGTRIELSGPALLISASAAQALGMALHELATNAGKFGAFSNDTGRVALHWSVEPAEGGGETFLISWRERGGPAVKPPARPGFGSTVLRRAIKESLDAQVELDFQPTGLVWRLQCPAGGIMEGSRSA